MRQLLITATLVWTTALLASNGTNLIGHGPISNGMGGIGVALPMHSESIIKNPAIMNVTREFDLSFSATYLDTITKAQNSDVNNNFQEQTSSTKATILPSVGFIHQVMDNVVLGLGLFETSRSSVDFRNSTAEDGIFRVSSNMSVSVINGAINYSVGALKVGVGAQVGYGSLSTSMYDSINFDPDTFRGAGEAHAQAYGFNAGAAFWIVQGLNVAVSYQSALTFDYQPVLTNMADNFDIGPTSNNLITGDKMAKPAEIGFGFAFVKDLFTISCDYKIVQWSAAAGYKELGWDDQNVIAVGLAANILNGSTIRVGYNNANNPQGETAVKNSWADIDSKGTLNSINMLNFPAFAENHYTFGFSQIFSRTFALDLAAIISPEVTVISEGMTDDWGNQLPITTKQSQTAYTIAGHWM